MKYDLYYEKYTQLYVNTNIILKSSDKNVTAVIIKMIPQEIRNMLKNK